MSENSFNEFLEKIPTKYTEPLSVLERFYVNNLVNIEKDFLSVGIRKEDRDAVRLLWVDDPTLSHPSIRESRFTPVCFEVISSMGYLGQKIRNHLEKFKEKTSAIVENVQNLLHVDNLLMDADTMKDGRKIFRISKEIFLKAIMNLQKWSSNSKQMNEWMSWS